MAKIKLTEKVSVIISLIALLFSGLSFFFSYYVYNKSKEERIAIIAKPINGNSTIKVSEIGNYIVVPMFWEITISNNSDKNVSLVEINAQCHAINGIVMYSNMYGGIFSENAKVDFPINLNSGESKKYVVNLGILCDSNAGEIIKSIVQPSFTDKINSGTWTRVDILKKALAENGIDFYGNKTKGQFDGERIVLYEVDPKKQQTFTLRLTTSQKASFEKNIQLYMRDE